eukprot:bmy_13580T0
MLKLQVESKPIDLSVAKGGPCGVLAAVQGCVLQKLLFEGDSGADCARQLQPSDARRTRCLALAIADIVWRAGGHKRAVVTLTRTSTTSCLVEFSGPGLAAHTPQFDLLRGAGDFSSTERPSGMNNGLVCGMCVAKLLLSLWETCW